MSIFVLRVPAPVCICVSEKIKKIKNGGW